MAKTRNKTQSELGATPEFEMFPIPKIKLFQVMEEELDIIEKSNNSDRLLNFALFLIPIGVSFFIALKTASFTPDSRAAFVGIGCAAFFIGIILLCFWMFTNSDRKSMIKKIRERGKNKVGEDRNDDLNQMFYTELLKQMILLSSEKSVKKNSKASDEDKKDSDIKD